MSIGMKFRENTEGQYGIQEQEFCNSIANLVAFHTTAVRIVTIKVSLT